MVELPAVLSLWNSSLLSLEMVAAPALLAPEKVNERTLSIFAAPAVLLLAKASRPVLLNEALPALLVLSKFTVPPLLIVAAPPLIVIPAPVNVRTRGLATVKTYDEAPAFKVKPPIVVLLDTERAVTLEAPKDATPVGTMAGDQLAPALKLPEPGVANQVAFCARADVFAASANKPTRAIRLLQGPRGQ